MKKKIEIGLCLGNDKKKCAKALGIVVGFPGVMKASFDESKSKITVESEGVDSVELVKKLRKKMKYAQLMSVGEVEEKKKEEKKEEKKKENPPLNWTHYPCPPMYYCEPIVEYQPTSPCTIM